jgi:hypothetical protein
MQAVLNPILSRLSDVLDRKLLVAVPPLFAAVGSFIGAKSVNMVMLIAGNVLIGITLATIGVATSIPAEVLPSKYRSVANGIGFLGGTFGGLFVLPFSIIFKTNHFSGWVVFWGESFVDSLADGETCCGRKGRSMWSAASAFLPATGQRNVLNLRAAASKTNSGLAIQSDASSTRRVRLYC